MEFLDDMIKLFSSGKTAEVIDEISNFLDNNPQYKTIDYYRFTTPIEEILFDVYLGDIGSVKKLELDEALDEIYMVYAMAYMAENELNLAEKYLKTANKINPVSADILMILCELYQQKNQEEKIKPYVCDIFTYTYNRELLISNYFKLADYLYHTNKNMELYDHLLNFFMFLKSGMEEKSVKEDMKFFRANNVPVGFNPEIIKILFYLKEVYSNQKMVNSLEYFDNLLWEVLDFNEFLFKIENDGD